MTERPSATGDRPSTPVLAYVGIGSNRDGPAVQVERALAELARLGPLRGSCLYRSEPWGRGDQPWFVNAVAEMACERPARWLFERLQAIERAAGRTREGDRWGPRVLDLDLLLFGDQRIDQPDLVVPHPRFAHRRFVLAPLAELAPELEDPVSRQAVRRLLSELDDPGRVEKMRRPGGVSGSAPRQRRPARPEVATR